ncbi:MAG: cupin domain-containing protein [Reichenbachiella sp.]
MKYLAFTLTLFWVCTFQLHAGEHPGIKVETLSKTSQSWNGDALPAYAKGTPEVTILKITIPPKTMLPVHKHPYMNAGVLLSGSLKVVTQDKKILQMKAGDPIVEVIDTWHHGSNEGDVPAVIVVFYAGIKGQAITIKK